MADLPRLNGIIKQLEAGKHAFTSFSNTDQDVILGHATSKYDGIVIEGEHNAWDTRAIKDALQYLLNRKQIATSGSVAPAVTPIVRIPPNGGEMNQFFAKQALD